MPDEVQKQLADWIDTDVIAERILEDLEEQGIAATLEHGRQVWLSVLMVELSEAIENTVAAIFGGGLEPEKIATDGSIAE